MTTAPREQLPSLPQEPGIYIFRDKQKKILYIGKAKKLKNRVSSYFHKHRSLTAAKILMVEAIDTIEYTVTDTENEALLLETSLIKKHKPPYNVLLKDDKYWQYIVLDFEGVWPEIYTVRRPEFKKKKHAQYFGPYTSGHAVKESLRLIKKIFPICLKLPSESPPRKPQPCFNYHLGRCTGACMGETTPKAYTEVFADIKKFLTGSRAQLKEDLTMQMRDYGAHQQFESAARVRDQLAALAKLDRRQKVVLTSHEHLDIISVYRIDNKSGINLFKVRNGKLLDKFNTVVTAAPSITNEEVLESFVEQYYPSTTDLPETILTGTTLSFNEIEAIPIKQSSRGKKAQLIKLGESNAHEFLRQQQTFFDRELRKTAEAKKALEELKQKLSLNKLPHRIETYDISNIQGKFAVGAMVVFENGISKNSDYRIFNIKFKQTPDDPAMMYETLTRRLTKLSDSRFGKKPDLIVIDGGKTQLGSALEALAEHDVSIPVISLAKREEEVFIPNKKESLKLSKKSPALKLLQQGRDEAHRFGISQYRKRHGKDVVESVLDTIPGIGSVTKIKLLKQFKSIDGIRTAPEEALQKIIGKSKAAKIRQYL